MLTLRPAALWILVLWLAATPAALAERVTWDPSRTRAVIAGVLTWQDPSIGTFAVENRKDRELYETLLERGVPAQNITLLLDTQATHQGILEALSHQLQATRPGDTFLFYYAGHGVQRGGSAKFVPYDFRPGQGLGMDEVATLMEERFQGERAWLFADCCYSGALESVADRLESKGIQAASLTSATARIPSTSNWTFTQTLVDSFSGNSSVDHDGDLSVTFKEVASEVKDAMRFHDLQQSGVSDRAWFDDVVIATAPPVDRKLKEPFSLYDYAMIEYEGKKEIGRVAGQTDGNFVVELQAYSQRVPVEVPPENLKPLRQPPAFLSEEQAQRKAEVGGKYSELLRSIEVEPDYLEYGDFKDYGRYEACNYRGYQSLPEGYWVYVYPRWYIWAESKE